MICETLPQSLGTNGGKAAMNRIEVVLGVIIMVSRAYVNIISLFLQGSGFCC